MLLLFVLGLLPSSQLEEAKLDPAYNNEYTYYLSVGHVPEEQKQDLVLALKFVLPSLSLYPTTDAQIPQQVLGTDLYRIDTRAYGWEKSYPWVSSFNPYRHPKKYWSKTGVKYRSKIVPADWFIQFATLDEAYYRLLFDNIVFEKQDELFHRLAVNYDREFSFGFIEGNSRVATHGQQRWIQAYAMPGDYFWMTRDSRTLVGKSAPLENPQGDFEFDAGEGIFGIRKHYTNEEGKVQRGKLQGYMLANKKGEIQVEAPTDLVLSCRRIVTEEETKLIPKGGRKGDMTIRVGYSCMVCHEIGLNRPTTNLYEKTIQEVQLWSTYEGKIDLEAFFTNITQDIETHNEIFQQTVEHISGKPCRETIQALENIVLWYDQPVTLTVAATYLGVEEELLKSAIAIANIEALEELGEDYDGQEFPKALSFLTHGIPMSRDNFEEVAPELIVIIEEFQAQ